jgi:hypothetical protein
MVVASLPEPEAAAQDWLAKTLSGKTNRREVADILLQAWWCLTENKSFGENMPGESERQEGWRKTTHGRVVEMGWLARKSPRPARYDTLTLAQAGL